MSQREGMTSLIQALAEELGRAVALTGLDPQFHRRLIVRVLFSVFEGYAYHVRQRALEAGRGRNYPFSNADLTTLTEQEERQRPNGTVEVRQRFIKSEKALSVSVRIFSEVMGVPPPPNAHAPDLATGFAVRDRLTHPKAAASFVITDDEAQTIARLGTWFSLLADWYTKTDVNHIETMRTSISASIRAQIASIESDQ